MSDHTPTPWKVEPGEFTVRADALPLRAATGLASGAVCVAVESDEDAAFIVRACNSHDALVQALKAWRGTTTCYAELFNGHCTEAEPCPPCEAQAATRAALTQVEP